MYHIGSKKFPTLSMDIRGAIAQLGLNDKEVRLYLAALELGVAPAREIARKSGIQRTHFYDLSRRLLALGLLLETRRGGKRSFAALEPSELVALQQERLRRIEAALPELNAMHNTAGQQPRVFFYEGRAGINHINDDTLRHDGEIVAFTTPRFVTIANERLHRDYSRRRIALGKRARIIGEVSPEVRSLQARDAVELRETRMLPASLFPSDVEFGVYGNRVFIVDYRDEYGLTIESSTTAATLRMVFDLVWNSGRIVA